MIFICFTLTFTFSISGRTIFDSGDFCLGKFKEKIKGRKLEEKNLKFNKCLLCELNPSKMLQSFHQSRKRNRVGTEIIALRNFIWQEGHIKFLNQNLFHEGFPKLLREKGQ